MRLHRLVPIALLALAAVTLLAACKGGGGY